VRHSRRRLTGSAAFLAVALLLAPALRADSHAEILDVLGSMATALGDGNVPEFMKPFDRNMPGYDTLHGNISALAMQGEVASSIQPLKDEGDDAKRTMDLDWYMEIRSADPAGPLVRRREVVHCRFEKQGKHWKITFLDPISFFAPSRFDSQ
jgi:hypothetical protein